MKIDLIQIIKGEDGKPYVHGGQDAIVNGEYVKNFGGEELNLHKVISRALTGTVASDKNLKPEEKIKIGRLWENEVLGQKEANLETDEIEMIKKRVHEFWHTPIIYAQVAKYLSIKK